MALIGEEYLVGTEKFGDGQQTVPFHFSAAAMLLGHEQRDAAFLSGHVLDAVFGCAEREGWPLLSTWSDTDHEESETHPPNISSQVGPEMFFGIIFKFDQTPYTFRASDSAPETLRTYFLLFWV